MKTRCIFKTLCPQMGFCQRYILWMLYDWLETDLAQLSHVTLTFNQVTLNYRGFLSYLEWMCGQSLRSSMVRQGAIELLIGNKKVYRLTNAPTKRQFVQSNTHSLFLEGGQNKGLLLKYFKVTYKKVYWFCGQWLANHATIIKACIWPWLWQYNNVELASTIWSVPA